MNRSIIYLIIVIDAYNSHSLLSMFFALVQAILLSSQNNGRRRSMTSKTATNHTFTISLPSWTALVLLRR